MDIRALWYERRECMKISHISKKYIRLGEEVSVKDIREGVAKMLKADFPDIDGDHYISIAELNRYRKNYLAAMIIEERGALAAIDRDVMNAIKNNSILSENIQEVVSGELSFGQRLADKVASFGGSWTFILSFTIFIVVWIVTNVWILTTDRFDPYPFILLNLMLSFIAAFQAPIIMMSQNRQEQKDREQSLQDYKVNLKAELEIKLLSEKVDHLIIHQNKKLLEIQQVQVDYLEDLMKELQKIKDKNEEG